MSDPQPLIGYRSWLLDLKNDGDGLQQIGNILNGWIRPDRGVELHAMTPHRRAWNLDGPTEIHCSFHNHERPHPKCGCGLHAFGRPENVLTYYAPNRLDVLGAVKAWGADTCLFEQDYGDGFRAQKAIPVGFLLPERERHQSMLREVAGRLGVPVVPDRQRLIQLAGEFGQSVSEALGEGPETASVTGSRRRYWLAEGLDAWQKEMEAGQPYRPPVRKSVPEPDANLISSLCEDGWHRGVLDVDNHAPPVALSLVRRAWQECFGHPLALADMRVIASSTPGHSHLYLEAPLRFSEYRALLQDLLLRGLLEPGYVSASLQARMSFVRKPGVLKPGARLSPSEMARPEGPPF